MNAPAAGALLARGAEALLDGGRDGAAAARAALAELDELLLAGLLAAAREPAGGAQGRFAAYAFYRRRLLRRLARARRLDPERAGALYADAGGGRLILFTTHACQLRCAYCRSEKHGATMSPEVALAGVSMLSGTLRSEPELQFFGGEPLLAPALVLRAAEAAARLARPPRLLLTTNGVALSPRTAERLRAAGFRLEVSCDGPPDVMRAQRPAAGGRDAHARVLAGLAAAREAGLERTVIAVLTPERAGRAVETVRYLAGLGERRVQLNYALGRLWDEPAVEALERGLAEASAEARRLGVVLANDEPGRREPVMLNGELTVDCDGTLYREVGSYFESDFSALPEPFKAGRVESAGWIDGYGATRFDALSLQLRCYGSRPERLRLVLNNLELGMRLAAARSRSAA